MKSSENGNMPDLSLNRVRIFADVPVRMKMSISNVLDSALKLFTTQAIFTAIGLSPGTVSTIAIAWTMMDIIGKVGKFGASFLAEKIDGDPSSWHFRGKGLTQAADIMDLTSPIIPGAFVPLTVMSKITQSAAETINTCSLPISIAIWPGIITLQR